MKRIKTYKQWYYKLGLFYIEYTAYNLGLGINIQIWKEPAMSLEINLSFIGTIQLYMGKNKNGNQY